jgi:hypothetical protein
LEFYGKTRHGRRLLCLSKLVLPLVLNLRLRLQLMRSAALFQRERFLPRFALLLLLLPGAELKCMAQVAAPQTVAVDPAVQAKATAGDAAAQVKLGEAYATGNGAPRDTRQLTADYKQAAGWYRKAADQGNLAAEVHLADLYRDGRGVTRDMTQAVEWYRKAADAGDAGAQGTLGILYSVGMGIPKDDVEAYYWLSLAADQKGPNQPKWVNNRQSVGEHITTDQQSAVEDRVAAWKAAHPHVMQ